MAENKFLKMTQVEKVLCYVTLGFVVKKREIYQIPYRGERYCERSESKFSEIEVYRMLRML